MACTGRWLRIIISLLVVAGLAVSGAGCLVPFSTPTTNVSPPTAPATVSEITTLIYTLVNEERAKLGLPLLEWDSFLEGLATEHSENMVRLNYFGHDRYGWRGLDYQQAPGTIRAENLAQTPRRKYKPGPLLSSKEVAAWAIQGWLTSPKHKEAMLDGRLTRTGVGVAQTDDYFYITQDFQGDLV